MSFLLLGILNAQAAGAAGGAYDLLETQTLASSASSVTFTGLDALTNYNHLQLRAVSRTDRADSNDSVYVRFNGDSGNNYSRHSMEGIGISVNSGNAASQSSMVFISSGATETANVFAPAVMDILDFSSGSKNTTIKTLNAFGTNQIRIDSGAWFNTNAVTSLTLQPSISNFIAGSRFSLYGWRAA